MKTRWVYPFLIALVLGWLVGRPSKPSFVRLPGGGGPAPHWVMTNLLGQAIDSSAFTGKIIVLNFWATWCPPCRQEIPELNAFQRSQKTNDVIVIGAATDADGMVPVKSFLARHSLDYFVLLADPEVQQSFVVSGLPSTWVVNRDGRVVARYLGAINARELNQVVGRLLNAAGSSPP